MDPKDQQRLNKNRIRIRDEVLASQIIPYLLQEGVLTEDDAQRITISGTDRDQMDKLLYMLPSRGSKAYKTFVESLQENWEWIVRELENTETTNETPRNEAAMDKAVTKEMVKAMQKNHNLILRWKALAISLDLESSIPGIEYKVKNNCEDLNQSLYYLMEDWKQVNGKRATVGALIHALTEEKFIDVAQHVEEIANAFL